MRALNLANTAVDLSLQDVPFLANNTVVVLNVTSGNLVLQECDTTDGSYTTLATVTPGAQQVTLNKQFIKVSTAATLTLLGN